MVAASLSPARRPGTGTIHASAVRSACTNADVAAHNRHDPYWGQLWAPGSQALWFTNAMARRRSEGHARTVNKKLLPDDDEALRVLTSNRGRAERLAAWGVLDSWRTASAEQIGAFTGSSLFLDPTYSTLASSFALGLTDLGTFSHPMSRLGMDRNTVYRPANSDVFEKIITPTLTWPEWASVTGGQPWSSGGQYDRHNILATELALRAAEYLPVGAVLGEKFSTVELLAGTGLGKTVKNPDKRRADGVIVRGDGMRVAYELTASASKGFENKIRRWAQIISERPLETSGLTVLFIAAPHPDRSRHSSADPRHEIYRRMSQILREFPGTGPTPRPPGSGLPIGRNISPESTSSPNSSSPSPPTSPSAPAPARTAGFRRTCSGTTPSRPGKRSTRPRSQTTLPCSRPPRTGCGPAATPT